MRLAHVSMGEYDLSLKWDSFQDHVYFSYFLFIPTFHFYRHKFWKKIVLTTIWMGCENFSIAISPISLNFLQVICQNPRSDLSSKIIFNSLNWQLSYFLLQFCWKPRIGKYLTCEMIWYTVMKVIHFLSFWEIYQEGFRKSY